MAAETRPTYSMNLPSGGLLYAGKIPFGTIEYYPMTAREEKMLAGAKGSAGSVLDLILKSCVKLDGITVGELLTADRFFILLILRSTSYGSEYKFNMTCGACNQRFQHKVTLDDVDTFPIKTLDADATEPFEVTLPASQDVIKFRLLRGDDEKAIQKYADQAFSRGDTAGDPTYTYRIARHVTAINSTDYDVSRISEVNRYIEKLIGRDSVALRNAIEKADCGVDITIRMNCPKCDDFIEQSMPMTAEFFRPRD